MDNKRPERFNNEMFAFEGRSRTQIIKCVPMSMQEFNDAKKLFPVVMLIDELRRLYKYVVISQHKYAYFIKKTKHDTKKIDSIVMQKMVWDYESVLIDYLLKSSVFINNVRTHNKGLINESYQFEEFRFVIILRNLLEHNQIPLSKVTYKRLYHRSSKNGKMKEKRIFIASARKDILVDFIKQKHQKNYVSDNIAAIDAMPSLKDGNIIISEAIKKHQKIIANIFEREIGELVSEIPDVAIEVLDKYYDKVKGKKFNLSGISHFYTDDDGRIYSLDSEFYILERETVVLINNPSK
ncbi:hypothetical protein, partial [Levilactobacillus zymae]